MIDPGVPPATAPAPRPEHPERALLVALLHGAVLDLADQRPGCARQRERARLWIMGADAPLSFATVCDLLDIEAQAARVALLDAEHRDRARVLFEIGTEAAA